MEPKINLEALSYLLTFEPLRFELLLSTSIGVSFVFQYLNLHLFWGHHSSLLNSFTFSKSRFFTSIKEPLISSSHLALLISDFKLYSQHKGVKIALPFLFSISNVFIYLFIHSIFGPIDKLSSKIRLKSTQASGNPLNYTNHLICDRLISR